MPELPEVEAARRLVENNCLGKVITKAVVEEDEKVIQGCTPKELMSTLTNSSITSISRQGKYLYCRLNGNASDWILFHFGMTGALVVEGVGGGKYKRSAVDMSEWPPRFTKFHVEFENGTRLAFTDPRRFGRVTLLKEDPLTQPPLNKLGPDALLALPAFEDFKRLFERSRSGKIKALLLDQGLLSGIGNWVGDEILYQARVHPESTVACLTPEQFLALYEATKNVLEVAVAADADSERFPKDWLFHFRWTNKKHSSINGHTIAFVTVGSRTSAYVPHLQKLSKQDSLPSAAKVEVVGEEKPTKGKKSAGKKGEAEEEEEAADTSAPAAVAKRPARKRPSSKAQTALASLEGQTDDDNDDDEPAKAVRNAGAKKAKLSGGAAKAPVLEPVSKSKRSGAATAAAAVGRSSGTQSPGSQKRQPKSEGVTAAKGAAAKSKSAAKSAGVTSAAATKSAGVKSVTAAKSTGVKSVTAAKSAGGKEAKAEKTEGSTAKKSGAGKKVAAPKSEKQEVATVDTTEPVHEEKPEIQVASLPAKRTRRG